MGVHVRYKDSMRGYKAVSLEATMKEKLLILARNQNLYEVFNSILIWNEIPILKGDWAFRKTKSYSQLRS